MRIYMQMHLQPFRFRRRSKKTSNARLRTGPAERMSTTASTTNSAEQPVAGSIHVGTMQLVLYTEPPNSAGQPVTGSSHRTTEPATEHSHAPQASATAAEHGSERWETAPAAADKWQVKFPSGWWDLPPEASAEIHQQYLRGEATAAYMQCRSKKRDEWQPYRIDFNRMEQTNTVSGRTRMARCIPTVADVADKATSSMEPANYGVWQEPCSAAEPL